MVQKEKTEHALVFSNHPAGADKMEKPLRKDAIQIRFEEFPRKIQDQSSFRQDDKEHKQLDFLLNKKNLQKQVFVNTTNFLIFSFTLKVLGAKPPAKKKLITLKLWGDVVENIVET